MATFFFLFSFFFFFEPGVKLDEKSIENGLEGQKVLVVCLSGVVARFLGELEIQSRVQSINPVPGHVLPVRIWACPIPERRKGLRRRG